MASQIRVAGHVFIEPTRILLSILHEVSKTAPHKVLLAQVTQYNDTRCCQAVTHLKRQGKLMGITAGPAALYLRLDDPC